MSYKIFVETDMNFRICYGEFESFVDAKAQVQRMIMEMFESIRSKHFYDAMDDFIDAFPENVAALVRSFEECGAATADFTDEGNTDTCHYIVSETEFNITDNEEEMVRPEYAIQTDMVNMSGDRECYTFRMWSCIGGEDEGLSIILKSDSCLESKWWYNL